MQTLNDQQRTTLLDRLFRRIGALDDAERRRVGRTPLLRGPNSGAIRGSPGSCLPPAYHWTTVAHPLLGMLNCSLLPATERIYVVALPELYMTVTMVPPAIGPCEGATLSIRGC